MDVGVIQEQGDLGLGFNPVTPEERRQLQEQEQEAQKQEEKQK